MKQLLLAIGVITLTPLSAFAADYKAATETARINPGTPRLKLAIIDEPNWAAGERVMVTFAVKSAAGVVSGHNIFCGKEVFATSEPVWPSCAGWLSDGEMAGKTAYPVKVSVIKADGSHRADKPPATGPIREFAAALDLLKQF